MLKTRRKEALSAGEDSYFTGKPCKRGHVAERWSSNGRCKECSREDQRTEPYREKAKEYARKPHMREWFRAWDRAYSKTDKRRAYHAANQGERRARKLLATPDWLTDEQKFEIRQIYELAEYLTSTTGERHEVDHIIPLRHPDVRGLHVPWNLQVLTATENSRKGSYFHPRESQTQLPKQHKAQSARRLRA